MADSDAPFRCPHGTAFRGERRMGCPDLVCDPSDIYMGASAALLRAAAQRRQGPGSSDGRFVTLRVCHWMAVVIRQVCGRLSAAKPCACSAAKCVRLRRRGCDEFGRFVHSAWVWRVCPVAICWLEATCEADKGASTVRTCQRQHCDESSRAAVFRPRHTKCTQDKHLGHLGHFGTHMSKCPSVPNLPAPQS